MSGYGDDSGFAQWLTANGYTLPVGAPAVAVIRQRGSSYTDGLYGARFSGTPTGGYAQDRAWPRTGATAYGTDIPDTAIPQAVIDASYAAAYQEASEPGSLAVVVDPAQRVKRQKVDVIEREFFEPGDSSTVTAPVLSVIEGLLAPFLTVSTPWALVV